ncbi:unnamed protein product, partial [Protopolystoma xenopodis]
RHFQRLCRLEEQLASIQYFRDLVNENFASISSTDDTSQQQQQPLSGSMAQNSEAERSMEDASVTSGGDPIPCDTQNHLRLQKLGCNPLKPKNPLKRTSFSAFLYEKAPIHDLTQPESSFQ